MCAQSGQDYPLEEAGDGHHCFTVYFMTLGNSRKNAFI